MKFFQRIWSDIRRGENVDLYLTVLVSTGLVILNLLGIAPANLIAPLTLAVLALLGITSLGTRFFIEEKIKSISGKTTNGLLTRAEIPPLEDRGKNAAEIIIVGTTLYTAVIPNLDFFENKLKNGCKLKFLLLDPRSQAASTFSLTTKVPNQVANIEQSLKALEELISLSKTTKGKCEVRLSPAYLSFGMAGFDISKEIGFINVQIYSYKSLGEIPNMILQKRNDTKWFEYFIKQFDLLWADSRVHDFK
jgi:hypothetical protein